MAAQVSIEAGVRATGTIRTSRPLVWRPGHVARQAPAPPPAVGGRRGARLPRAGRQLHALDVENLMGGPRFTPAEVSWLRDRYTTLIPMATLAQVVLGASVDQSALAMGVGWTGAGLRLRRGRNGADLELLALLEREGVAERFDDVYIGSGDAIFAPVAAQLAAQGVTVTVVSRRDGLARLLRLAAHHVVYLDARRPAGVRYAPAAS